MANHEAVITPGYSLQFKSAVKIDTVLYWIVIIIVSHSNPVYLHTQTNNTHFDSILSFAHVFCYFICKKKCLL